MFRPLTHSSNEMFKPVSHNDLLQALSELTPRVERKETPPTPVQAVARQSLSQAPFASSSNGNLGHGHTHDSNHECNRSNGSNHEYNRSNGSNHEYNRSNDSNYEYSRSNGFNREYSRSNDSNHEHNRNGYSQPGEAQNAYTPRDPHHVTQTRDNHLMEQGPEGRCEISSPVGRSSPLRPQELLPSRLSSQENLSRSYTGQPERLIERTLHGDLTSSATGQSSSNSVHMHQTTPSVSPERHVSPGSMSRPKESSGGENHTFVYPERDAVVSERYNAYEEQDRPVTERDIEERTHFQTVGSPWDVSDEVTNGGDAPGKFQGGWPRNSVSYDTSMPNHFGDVLGPTPLLPSSSPPSPFLSPTLLNSKKYHEPIDLSRSNDMKGKKPRQVDRLM
ncbi:hypothetical protein BGZ65_002016, partial [Modicella reniformis]